VLGRDGAESLGQHLGLGDLPAELPEPRCTIEDHRLGGGVGQHLGQGTGLVTAVQGLLRIAQRPQRPGQITVALPARSLAIPHVSRAVRLQGVLGDPLLQVPASGRKGAQEVQGRSQRRMGREPQGRVVLLLRQGEELLPELSGGLEGSS
jgi:hypothetical protein